MRIRSDRKTFLRLKTLVDVAGQLSRFLFIILWLGYIEGGVVRAEFNRETSG